MANARDEPAQVAWQEAADNGKGIQTAQQEAINNSKDPLVALGNRYCGPSVCSGSDGEKSMVSVQVGEAPGGTTVSGEAWVQGLQKLS